MPRPMITAILTAHREGMLAKPSIESLIRCVALARQSDVSVEAIAVLDRSDSLTKDIVANYVAAGVNAVDVDFGDPGRARNYAADIARGRYLAFLDADDMWGTNWLTKAVYAARRRDDPIVWHPEVCVYFGGAHHLFHHIDMEDPLFSPATLAVENYWTALSFAARNIYVDNPYPDTDLETGFGFEDWAWNMQTIANGIIHKTVADTGHIIRRKTKSVSRDTISAKGVPRPTSYLAQYLRARCAKSS